jgi:hypothetical protein
MRFADLHEVTSGSINVILHHWDGLNHGILKEKKEKLTLNCRVPQLISVLLTEFLSAFDIFSVYVEINFLVVD